MIRKRRLRGSFFKKEEWWSICSKHIEYDENCKTCNIGSWKNVWKHNMSAILYDISPKIWIYFNN